MFDHKIAFLSFCIISFSVVFGSEADFSLIPGQNDSEAADEVKSSKEADDDDGNDQEVKDLRQELNELKKLVLAKSDGQAEPEDVEVKKAQESSVEEAKVYDRNFDSIKKYQDKLREIVNEFEGKLSVPTDFPNVEMIEKIISSLPKEITSGSSVREELLDDLGEIKTILENLNLKEQRLTAMLFVAIYLVCDHGLIDLCLQSAHDQILNDEQSKNLLERSVGNIGKFMANDFVSSLISLVLKASEKDNVPSYFVFNFVNCLTQLVAKEKSELNSIFQEFSRKSSSIVQGIEAIVSKAKEKSKSPEVPDVCKPFFESEAKIHQEILGVFQKSINGLKSDIDFKTSCLNMADQIFKDFASSKKNDEILAKVQETRKR